MSRVYSLAIHAADHLVAKGRLDAAASILRNYLATNPPRPDILQRLGRILLAQGRSDEAVPLFQQALNEFKNPNSEPQTSDATATKSTPTAEATQAVTASADVKAAPVLTVGAEAS